MVRKEIGRLAVPFHTQTKVQSLVFISNIAGSHQKIVKLGRNMTCFPSFFAVTLAAMREKIGGGQVWEQESWLGGIVVVGA